jgi:hypothetical protein
MTPSTTVLVWLLRCTTPTLEQEVFLTPPACYASGAMRRRRRTYHRRVQTRKRPPGAPPSAGHTEDADSDPGCEAALPVSPDSGAAAGVALHSTRRPMSARTARIDLVSIRLAHARRGISASPRVTESRRLDRLLAA